MKLKVLYIISKMGKGGAQQITLNLVNKLSNDGIQIDLLILFRTPQDTAVLCDLDPRVQIVEYLGGTARLPSDHSWTWQKAATVFLLPFSIFKNVWDGNFQKYDIVHSHLMLASFVSNLIDLFQRILSKSRPRFVETFHADLVSLSRFEVWIFMLLWQHLDMLILELRRRDMTFLAARLPRVAMRFIPFGIPLPPSPAAEKRGQYLRSLDDKSLFSSKASRIVSITRLNVGEKHVDKLIEVIYRLKTSLNEPFQFLLCGDGPDKEKLQVQVKSLMLDEVVIFVGYIDEVFKYLDEANAFLIAGIEDQVGIAGLQAASLSVPVASYQADPEWRTHNSEDVFYHSSSIVDLAEHIRRLCEDRDFYLSECRRSSKIIESKYSIAAMISNYTRAYSTLLNGEKAAQ